MQSKHQHSAETSSHPAHKMIEKETLKNCTPPTLIHPAAYTLPPSKEIKIRFINEDEEVKGLEVILTSDQDIMRCYDNDVYGLVSEKQVRLLNDNGVKFKSV